MTAIFLRVILRLACDDGDVHRFDVSYFTLFSMFSHSRQKRKGLQLGGYGGRLSMHLSEWILDLIHSNGIALDINVLPIDMVGIRRTPFANSIHDSNTV